MSRSRLTRCLLLTVLLATLAPAGASAQPLAPASPPCSPTCSTAATATAPAPACLPTCGSDVYVPLASRQNRSYHTAVVALAAHPANQTSDAGLATHRLDLSDQAAATTVHLSDAGLAAHRLDLSDQAATTTVRSSDAGLAAHRLDLSEPTAAATARPACLPTCGSASAAPRVTPVSPSALSRANAMARHRSAPASTPVSATQTSTPDSSKSGVLVRDAAILGVVLLVAGIAVATRHRLRPLGSQPR
jgi:hypothetical protein